MRVSKKGQRATEALVEAYRRLVEYRDDVADIPVIWSGVQDAIDRVEQAGQEMGFDVAREARS
jgi:hypothetical protein